MHGSRKEMKSPRSRNSSDCSEGAMRSYPAILTSDSDSGGFTVTFRDVPEAITEGDTREEALLRAEDALESALAMYIAAKEPLPIASPAGASEVSVPLSGLGMAKTALYQAMREQGVGNAELARRLRWHLVQVSRVIDPRHASKMEQVEAALAALGLRLIVDVAKAA
jgi:antitoxin HicB